MKNWHWIQGDNECESPLFRRSFSLRELPASAKLEICGLGYFLLYVNGRRACDQEFVPAFTNYSSVLGCDTTYPVWEERSRYRCLYLTVDLLPFLKTGENVLGIQLGNGWYHQTKRVDEGKFIFGFPKLRYELHMLTSEGEEVVIESDPKTLWKPGEVTENNLFYGETQDLRLLQEDWCMESADVAGWKPARPVHAPETILEEQKCPADRVLRRIQPVLLEDKCGRKLYDCRENIAGWAEIRCLGKTGEQVSVRYSEELTDDGCLDFRSAGGERQIQKDCYICNGSPVTVRPKFCWHGFRYFEVEGAGEAVSVAVVGTQAPVVSSFRCSNPVLNWLYDAYIRTQAANFHNCIPSDCPHREKLGYTGDGQLTSETAMLTMDTRRLYEKWYQDILDSQGADTGHIPHTAPFMGGGGGPGGWGCAVYVVPMDYWRVFGDSALLEKGYPAILRWLEYMESRCEKGLVVREEEGGWCLGEWCAPEAEPEKLPEAFVNTCFYIQGLQALGQITQILHKEEPEWVKDRILTAKKAVMDTFFDANTGNFCGGTGAANAFALNVGLGTAGTKKNLVDRYRKLGRLDTGIFGTPVLLEWLFKEGEADLAFRLLTNDNEVSFANMMRSGATTLWEKWDGADSHNHPMFGNVVKLLFTEVLGIRQKEGTCGFAEYYVMPADIKGLDWAQGTMRTAAGLISVKWNRDEDGRMQVESWEAGSEK